MSLHLSIHQSSCGIQDGSYDHYGQKPWHIIRLKRVLLIIPEECVRLKHHFRLPNRLEIGLSKYVIPLLTKMSSTIFVIPYCLRRGRPMYLSKKYQYYLKVVCYYQRFLLCYSWYKPPFFWFSANSIITKTECLYLFIFGFLCIFNLIQHKFRLRSMRYIQHRKMGRL